MPRKEPGAGTVIETQPAVNSTPAQPVYEITSSDDWFVPLEDEEEFLNAVFYGREGSGKSTSLARMTALPGTGKVLVVNAEGGLKVKALRKHGVDTSQIAVWPNKAKGEKVSFQGLDMLHRRILADLQRDPTSWKGVGLDSATDIFTAILDHVQAKRVHKLKMAGKDVDEDFVDISDYGTMSKMFRDIVRKFRDLPCHVVITALERRDVDKDTGKPQYGPAVTPGLMTDLLGYADVVLMCKAADEDGPFRALTRANSRYRAKDRFDVLPRVMAEPTFDRIMAYVEGTLTEDTDPFQDDLGSAKIAQDAPPVTKQIEEAVKDQDVVDLTASDTSTPDPA